MEILRKRTDIPRVLQVDGQDRLVILPGEDKEITTSTGRPIGREYFDVSSKLKFMDRHSISKSVISLANPWLDFLTGDSAKSAAEELNDELQSICEQSQGRLFGFATLPVRNPKAAVAEVARLKTLSCIKGVILGTPGAGKGLDDENMRDVLAAIEDNDYMIFLHPHYGVGNEHYGDSGHALFLALGFPFETTVSVARMIVSGTLDRHPNLKLLVAHAGAALPALMGRLDSCVAHESAPLPLQHAPSTYFKRLYFDAISYNGPALQSLIDQVGEDRIVFGTDNPFFPPPGVPSDTVADGLADWPSTRKVQAVLAALSPTRRTKILSGNAADILKLR